MLLANMFWGAEMICLGDNQQNFKKNNGGNFGGKLWEKMWTEQGWVFLGAKVGVFRANYHKIRRLTHSDLSTLVDNLPQTVSQTT